MNKSKMVLLSAGSFNPITYGHLLMLENVRNFINNNRNSSAVTQYNIVGAFISPVNQEYGKAGLLSADHRLRMCDLGVQSSDWIKVNPWEITRNQEQMKKLRENLGCDPSFKGVPTVAVIQNLKQELAASADATVSVGFVCGADLFIGFENPHWWTDNEIEMMVGDHIFVLERDDSDIDTLKKTIINRSVLQKLQERITFIKPSVRNDVSSSAVRKLLRENRSVKYLIPDPVVDYIKEHNLYVE